MKELHEKNERKLWKKQLRKRENEMKTERKKKKKKKERQNM